MIQKKRLRRPAVCVERFGSPHVLQVRKEAEAAAKLPKRFDDQLPGYPPAFEWFVVDLRRERKALYDEQDRARAKFKADKQLEAAETGQKFDSMAMQEERFDIFYSEFSENYRQDNDEPEGGWDVKKIKMEAKEMFMKTSADALNEDTLYKEAELKWAGMSRHQREYYEVKSREMPIANLRVKQKTSGSYFAPLPFEAYMDLLKARFI